MLAFGVLGRQPLGPGGALLAPSMADSAFATGSTPPGVCAHPHKRSPFKRVPLPASKHLSGLQPSQPWPPISLAIPSALVHCLYLSSTTTNRSSSRKSPTQNSDLTSPNLNINPSGAQALPLKLACFHPSSPQVPLSPWLTSLLQPALLGAPYPPAARAKLPCTWSGTGCI